MKAVEQNVPIGSETLREKLSGIVIPWRRITLYLTLCVGFFLLGFVPAWLKASRAIEQRDAAQREVILGQLENSLGAATIHVQRGEYEPARQTMSDFYTNLRGQIDATGNSIFTPAQREQLRLMLADRDEIITLLARSDPGATDRMFHVYSAYKKTIK